MSKTATAVQQAPIVVPPGGGDPFRFGEGQFIHKVSSRDTNGVFAVVDHAPCQSQGLGCDAEVGKAGCKTRQAQDADRVFGKGLRDMAQHALLQIALAAVGVDQLARLVFSHRVDRQVAPREAR